MLRTLAVSYKSIAKVYFISAMYLYNRCNMYRPAVCILLAYVTVYAETNHML